MDVIEEIKERLRKYPHVKYKAGDNSIVIFPLSENGFEVWLSVLEGEYKVNFEGWYERFEDKDEALNCFALGLSSECRVKEYRRGGVAYKWALESKENGAWVAGGTVGLFFFPLWRKKEVRYLQNNLIEGEDILSGRHLTTH
jgi:hypothetical protein